MSWSFIFLNAEIYQNAAIHGFDNALFVQNLLQLSWSRAQWLSSDSKDDIKVPEHVERRGEPVEVLRARLQYQSRKRGTLENGLLLR